ncbi:MAG: hypothetical protein AAGE84_02815 [Cyanobacteria bacterium P01_G01_bin.39]
MIRLARFLTNGYDPIYIGTSTNDTSITVALTEYITLREEILQQNRNRNQILSFGITALSLLISAGFIGIRNIKITEINYEMLDFFFYQF